MDGFIRVDGGSGGLHRSYLININNIAGIHVGDDSKSLSIYFHKGIGKVETLDISDAAQVQSILDFFEDKHQGYFDLRPGYAAPESPTESTGDSSNVPMWGGEERASL